MACSLGFYGDGISFRVVFSPSFWLRVLPGGAHLVQPRWMPERRILGGGWTCGVLFWPFPNSSGWWWLISFMFLIRTSCHKTTHANSYYGAWPGWAVSDSVLPITIQDVNISYYSWWLIFPQRHSRTLSFSNHTCCYIYLFEKQCQKCNHKVISKKKKYMCVCVYFNEISIFIHSMVHKN